MQGAEDEGKVHVGHQGLPGRRERTHVRDLGRIPKATL